MSNDSTYYFCSFIVVPSANRFGNQFYWKIVRWRMSQKIAKKHYEEAKTDDISSHSTHIYSMHINTRWEPPRTYLPPAAFGPISSPTKPITTKFKENTSNKLDNKLAQSWSERIEIRGGVCSDVAGVLHSLGGSMHLERPRMTMP